MTKTKTKRQLRGRNFQDALSAFRDMGIPFEVVRTGYTATVILSDGRRFLFSEGKEGPNVKLFSTFQLLRKSIKEAGIPPMPERINYYHLDKLRKCSTLPQEAWCYDLTAAYPHALYHMGLIDETMLRRLMSLPKAERLRVVGMLATKKTHIHYDGQEVVDNYTSENDTAPAFFAVCHQVGDLMMELVDHPSFLFFWVDGAYFDKRHPEVIDHFAACGYPCKEEVITDLKWSATKRYLFYRKESERKYLCLPQERKPAPQWICEKLSERRD